MGERQRLGGEEELEDAIPRAVGRQSTSPPPAGRCAATPPGAAAGRSPGTRWAAPRSPRCRWRSRRSRWSGAGRPSRTTGPGRARPRRCPIRPRDGPGTAGRCAAGRCRRDPPRRSPCRRITSARSSLVITLPSGSSPFSPSARPASSRTPPSDHRCGDPLDAGGEVALAGDHVGAPAHVPGDAVVEDVAEPVPLVLHCSGMNTASSAAVRPCGRPRRSAVSWPVDIMVCTGLTLRRQPFCGPFSSNGRERLNDAPRRTSRAASMRLRSSLGGACVLTGGPGMVRAAEVAGQVAASVRGPYAKPGVVFQQTGEDDPGEGQGRLGGVADGVEQVVGVQAFTESAAPGMDEEGGSQVIGRRPELRQARVVQFHARPARGGDLHAAQPKVSMASVICATARPGCWSETVPTRPAGSRRRWPRW